MKLNHLNNSLLSRTLVLVFILMSSFMGAHLFIGEGVHISEGTQIHVKDDLVLDTDQVSGKGEIVLSGDEKQVVTVVKSETRLAKISVKNKKGAEVKGKGSLVVTKKVYIAKGSSFSGKYLGDILYQDKTINTKIALASNSSDLKEASKEKVEEEFVPQVLGYGFIVNITETIKQSTTSSAKGLTTITLHNVIANKHDFINLPLINNYYTKESSDFNYTQTYQDEDFSNIFTPPKIS